VSKSWRDKRDNPPKGLPKIVDTATLANPAMEKRFGKGKMFIATPLLVDAQIRKVKKGKLVTTGIIRERLAKEVGADFTCPLTTGIFINIAARAAEEDRAAGRKGIAPYWRVVKDNGRLNEKFPGGVEGHAAKLSAEGYKLDRTTKVPRIADFEKSLQKL